MLVAAVEAILAQHGQPVGRLQELDESRHHEPNENQRAADPVILRDAFATIKNDDLDYDEWVLVGMALKGALGENGREDFLKWSALSSKYRTEQTTKAWASFAPKVIGAGTVFHLAKAAGWVRSTESLVLEPVVRRVADIAAEQITWLVKKLIPLGKFGLIAGDPGVGKSQVTLDLAAAVTAGSRNWYSARARRHSLRCGSARPGPISWAPSLSR